MKLNLYDENLNRLAFLDENYISLLWTENYNDVGSFTLEVVATDKNKSIIKPDYFISSKDRKTLMIIKSVEISGDTVVANGCSAAYMLDDVAYIGTIESGSKIVKAIKSAYEATSGVPSIYIDDSDIETVCEDQISNKSVYELLKQLCSSGDIGFRSVKDGNSIKIEFYKPSENPNLRFSYKYGNIKEASLFLSTRGEKNCAIVLGQGDGENRARVEVDIRTDKNLLKKEIIVDARDLQRSDGETEENYISRLRERGIEKLINQISAKEIDFLPHSAGFGDRFDLGDVLTVLLPEYNSKIKARVSGVTIKSQNNGSVVNIDVGTIIDVSNVSVSTSGNMGVQADILGDAIQPSNDTELGTMLSSVLETMGDNTARFLLVHAQTGAVLRGRAALCCLYRRTGLYGTASFTTYGNTTSQGNLLCEKSLIGGTWYPIEWVNPDMVTGTEYRTTEKWKNKAVYTKAIDCGTFSAKAGTSDVAHGLTVTAFVECKAEIYHSGRKMCAPYHSPNGDLLVSVNENSVILYATKDGFNKYGAIVCLKYTKD